MLNTNIMLNSDTTLNTEKTTAKEWKNYAENKSNKYIPREVEKSLLSISPIDGRYSSKTSKLQSYFSEFALFKYRLRVEIEYFIFLIESGLSELERINHEENFTGLRKIYKDFSLHDCCVIKSIEHEIKHDVKAIEYFIRIKFEELKLDDFKSFIHFGLTSQDINNTATTLTIKHCIEKLIYNYIDNIQATLQDYAHAWKNISMISHTHGQPAVPTTVGKEFKVFWNRINKLQRDLYAMEYYGKFGGAVGNLNAHYAAYPQIDWFSKMNEFVGKLGLIRDPITTQIDNYENITCIFDCLKRINTVLIDLNRDIWTYISMNYFGQKIVAGEVGSSTMPHKVNPINFENSEGNLQIANTLLEFMSRKLPVSRLQRDLTDSTVLRNLGVIFGHCVIAYESLLDGMEKIELNHYAIEKDLQENGIVIVEAIQTVMRKYGYADAYEKCKDISRTNKRVTSESLTLFIKSLDVNEQCREELFRLDTQTYLGNAVSLINCPIRNCL